MPIFSLQPASVPTTPARSRELKYHANLEAGIPRRDHYQKNITIYVGYGSTLRSVPKIPAAARSTWFADKTRDGWLLGGSTRLVLPDVDIDTFGMWLLSLNKCMIDSEVDVQVDEVDLTPADNNTTTPTHLRTTSKETDQDFSNLVNLYALASDIEDVELRNAITDEFLEHSERTNTVPTLATSSSAYEDTPAGCTLQRLILELLIDFAHDDVFDPDRTIEPDSRNLMRQICAGRVVNGALGERGRNRTTCRYHEHGSGIVACGETAMEGVDAMQGVDAMHEADAVPEFDIMQTLNHVQEVDAEPETPPTPHLVLEEAARSTREQSDETATERGDGDQQVNGDQQVVEEQTVDEQIEIKQQADSPVNRRKRARRHDDMDVDSDGEMVLAGQSRSKRPRTQEQLRPFAVDQAKYETQMREGSPLRRTRWEVLVRRKRRRGVRRRMVGLCDGVDNG